MTTTSKEVVCMTAMGLSKCNEVESKLKGFISDTNKRHKGNPKPFIGHAGKSNAEFLDMVTAFCIEKKLVIIRDPPESNPDGNQRLFPENVIRAGQD
jgi:hypothetical protein